MFSKQPPPRGCVLKQMVMFHLDSTKKAAASARLCVETFAAGALSPPALAAASARLCVETIHSLHQYYIKAQPPPRGCVLKPLRICFGAKYGELQPPPRGCVLKPFQGEKIKRIAESSRLRAAVC